MRIRVIPLAYSEGVGDSRSRCSRRRCPGRRSRKSAITSSSMGRGRTSRWSSMRLMRWRAGRGRAGYPRRDRGERGSNDGSATGRSRTSRTAASGRARRRSTRDSSPPRARRFTTRIRTPGSWGSTWRSARPAGGEDPQARPIRLLRHRVLPPVPAAFGARGAVRLVGARSVRKEVAQTGSHAGLSARPDDLPRADR